MLIITAPANIKYFSGVELETYERFSALVLCRDGKSAFVAPKLDEGRIRGLVFSYADGEDPAEALRKAAEVCGGDRQVEVDGGTTARRLEVIKRALGTTEYKIADEYIYARRAVKREDEIEKIKRAARAVREVVEEAGAELKAGATERSTAARVYLGLIERGLEPGPILVQFGENTALPHQGPTNKRLSEGDAVIIDVTAAYQGYYGDITRSLAFRGKPEGYEDVHEAVREAQAAAIRAARTGVAAREVDAAARAALRAKGFAEYFVHRTGHGLGVEFHERPDISPASDEVLQDGNVFTIEPGVYLPGRFGVRIEDDVALVGGAAEIL